MLIVMAGLPGAGKSSIAEAAARQLGCAVISVDPIEAAIWQAGVSRSEPTGLAAYVVAEALAREQLRLAHDVILDAVNDVEPAREQWRGLARQFEQAPLFVEVFCPDTAEHRRRLSSRRRDLDGFPEPTWDRVLARRAAFDQWSEPRLRLDSTLDVGANALRLVAAVTERRSER